MTVTVSEWFKQIRLNERHNPSQFQELFLYAQPKDGVGTESFICTSAPLLAQSPQWP